MDKHGIYDLSKKMGAEFADITKLRPFLEDLLGEKRILPVVIGHDPHSIRNQGNLEIRELIPLTKSDVLTIDNYLEGISTLVSEKKYQEFGAHVFYEGLRTWHYSEQDSMLFSVWVRDRISKQDCFLAMYLSSARVPGKEHDRIGYAAASSLQKTRLEEKFSRFIGPNTKYKNIMI